MPSTSRAEQVLLMVLDCVEVPVADIREALDDLRRPLQAEERNHIQARVLRLEVIAAQAARVVEAEASWAESFKDDSIDMDGEYDKFTAATAALRPLLADLNDPPYPQTGHFLSPQATSGHRAVHPGMETDDGAQGAKNGQGLGGTR